MGRRLAGLVAAAVLCASCGSQPEAEPSPEPEPTTGRDTQPGLTKRDLRPALVRAEDVPPTHGTGFQPFFVRQDDVPSGSDVVSGEPECGDYLDGELGARALQQVESAYGDPSTTVTVTSRVEYFAEGDAEEVLATVRDLVEACDRFTMELEGQEVEVDAYLSELSEMDAYEGLGDDGVLVGLLVIIDGVPFRGTATTLLRVGDVVGTIGIEVPANFGRDPSPELVTVMDERLRDVVAAA
ncbi:hypothetical protein [Aeromicrobium sp. Leaf350]|uniref:hypothetical protein n=1 Tax=Aeromicrobium sp. Leaf350 TaxID=2876565 RepID=UPI001E643ED8|nr:hypothetical protein [Aeromicrobium sp. Leaf350]